jgi:dipeptidyl aminopeptidase/acylaminoacyl peptidase
MDFFRSLEKIEPVKSLAHYPGPTLLCHGAQDTVVDLSHSRAYAAARTGPDQITELLVLPESNHGFKPLSEDETLLKKTTAWFYKYIPQEKE